jgi:hypothetical protein
MRKFALILLFLSLIAICDAQHYIGEKKAYIITQFAYDVSVRKMSMNRESNYGLDYEVLMYRFGDRSQYYYINPTNDVCESHSALYDSPTAKDSLIRIFDKKYVRVDYPNDTCAMAWIEIEDGINYKRILRDFHPPTCLVVLAIDKKVED